MNIHSGKKEREKLQNQPPWEEGSSWKEPWSARTICYPGSRSGQREITLGWRIKSLLAQLKGEWNKPLPTSWQNPPVWEKPTRELRPDHHDTERVRDYPHLSHESKSKKKRNCSPGMRTTPLQPAAKASEPGARNATNHPEKQETKRQLSWNMGFTEVRNPSTLKGTSRSSKKE